MINGLDRVYNLTLGEFYTLGVSFFVSLFPWKDGILNVVVC